MELDSRMYHDDPKAFERDRAKWAVLTTAGEAVIALTSRRRCEEPELVARQLETLLRTRWRSA